MGQQNPPSPPPAPRQKKRKREEATGAAVGQRNVWGSRLPPELLTRIFQAVVDGEGAVPFLCRAARVCRDWNRVAAAPQLWRKVTLGGCWGAAPHKRLPHTVLGTVSWLVESRFSLLQEFVLCGWRSHVGFVLQALAARCPLLRSLELRHCEVDPPTLGRFLAAAGPRLQRLRLSCGPRVGPVLGGLASGACPHLRFLELDAVLGGSGPPLVLPVERLQEACGELEVLRLLDLSWAPPCGAPPAPPRGFAALRELSLSGSGPGTGCGVTDRLLRRLLRAAPALRRLDLRGCARVTPPALLQLPCHELELLWLGLPGGTEQLPRLTHGSAALARRWRRSLRDLDLSGRSFEEQDLAQAMAAFGPAAPLRALNLAGTRVTAGALSVLLSSCPDLAFLDLSACRRLPRGTKRPHRGRGEVRRCLRVMAGLDPDGDTPDEEPPGEQLNENSNTELDQ